jgi:hypothetical protein
VADTDGTTCGSFPDIVAPSSTIRAAVLNLVWGYRFYINSTITSSRLRGPFAPCREAGASDKSMALQQLMGSLAKLRQGRWLGGCGATTAAIGNASVTTT